MDQQSNTLKWCRAASATVAICILANGVLAHTEHVADEFRQQMEYLFATPVTPTNPIDDEAPGRYSTLPTNIPTGAVASSSDLSNFYGSQDPSTGGWTFRWTPKRKL